MDILTGRVDRKIVSKWVAFNAVVDSQVVEVFLIKEDLMTDVFSKKGPLIWDKINQPNSVSKNQPVMILWVDVLTE